MKIKRLVPYRRCKKCRRKGHNSSHCRGVGLVSKRINKRKRKKQNLIRRLRQQIKKLKNKAKF